jgi:hypothetical protein
MEELLPRQVIECLKSAARQGTRDGPLSVWHRDKYVRQAAQRVMEALGGVRQDSGDYVFDYTVRPVLDMVILNGCLPEARSHQFYPTPENLAQEAVRLANIQPEDSVLEPSAGQGHLAKWLPADRTQCVEVASLHCTMLREQGFTVHEGDFLAWAERAPRFDKVVMNPPFSMGRHQAHLETAARLVKPGGALVAILPVTATWPPGLEGWQVSESEPYAGEFAGASVTVKIVVAHRHR